MRNFKVLFLYVVMVTMSSFVIYSNPIAWEEGKLMVASEEGAAESIDGDWTGKLNLGGGRGLKLVFHISADPELSTIDSPDQGAYGLKCQIDYLSADSVSLSIPSLMMNYKGKLVNDKLQGVFQQRGMKLPLSLEAGFGKVNRPQTPHPPFPYKEEQVKVRNAEGNSTLAGTLTIPDGCSSATPVVILVSGSGIQNRDEELFEHKPFEVIADYFARNEIATLRYDDRGCGESTGDIDSATTADFASDAKAVMDWMRSQKRFEKIGILGHSEGGLISYILAASWDSPDFIVSVAGPSVAGAKILDYQNKTILMKKGVGEADAEMQAVAARRRIEMDQNPKMKWMQYFLKYDPADDMEKIQAPAFIAYGEKDQQVPPSINLEAAKRLVPHAEVKCYPGLNHMMQHADTGGVEEYGKIEETFSTEVLADIVSFINGLNGKNDY
ncbi:MAG: lysophospholipase [Muribaculum sp.]|nr:lysophospholipase [Muribaculum sp.]